MPEEARVTCILKTDAFVSISFGQQKQLRTKLDDVEKEKVS